MTKIGEEQDPEKIRSLSRRFYSEEEKGQQEAKFLVYFRIEKELPLIRPNK